MFLAEYFSRDRGWGFVSAKVEKPSIFSLFLAEDDRRNLDSYLIYAGC